MTYEEALVRIAEIDEVVNELLNEEVFDCDVDYAMIVLNEERDELEDFIETCETFQYDSKCYLKELKKEFQITLDTLLNL